MFYEWLNWSSFIKSKLEYDEIKVHSSRQIPNMSDCLDEKGSVWFLNASCTAVRELSLHWLNWLVDDLRSQHSSSHQFNPSL